jgi:hypothetical protein
MPAVFDGREARAAGLEPPPGHRAESIGPRLRRAYAPPAVQVVILSGERGDMVAAVFTRRSSEKWVHLGVEAGEELEQPEMLRQLEARINVEIAAERGA